MFSVAGMSRSVTVTTAYIMTVTDLGWREALNAVRGARRSANPNFGFQRQLLGFFHDHLQEVSLQSRGMFALTGINICTDMNFGSFIIILQKWKVNCG